MSTPTFDWLRARHAWVAALYACLINALGTPLLLLVGRDVKGLPAGPVLASAAAGALGAAVLMLRRRHASLESASVVFVVNNTAVALCLWLVIPAFAHAGAPWTPFQANKLGMLIVAALAPELVPGTIAIATMAACALLRMSVLDSPSAVDEPLVLIIFGVVAFVILVLRIRSLRAEYALAQARVDIDAAHQLSQRLLKLRDLANTPLQTIEVAVAVLEKKYPGEGELTGRVSRSIERLRGLRALLDTPRRR